MAYLKKMESILDFEDFYCVKSDPSAVLWSGFSSAPNRENLKSWFMKLIQDRSSWIYLLYDENVPSVIGYGKFTLKGEGEAEYEGISILSMYQGKGYSKLLTSLIVKEMMNLNICKISGWISEYNIPSIKSVEANQFCKKDEHKLIWLDGFKREDRFDLYERVI